jgi:hypothetical protein
MVTDGASGGMTFSSRWTWMVLAIIAAAFALSRLASTPGETLSVAQMPRELSLAIARTEPDFDPRAYDAPLLGRSAALWVGHGYLAPGEARELLALIEQGLERVEAYVSRTVEGEYGRGARIHYFARGGAFVSHSLGGYEQRNLRQPAVFLSFARERRAPYLHESAHIVAPDWSALWLREGLAVFLSRREGRWPMLLRFAGREIDANARDSEAQARACLATAAGRAAWDLVGLDGVPEFANRDVRTAFYLLSGALVECLDASCGRETLMAVYRSNNPGATLARRSGRSIEAWKQAWVRGSAAAGERRCS